MNEAVKITRFEIENMKRVRAVALNPRQNGLTVIGGRNGQGKTSVLDALAWALGGDRLKPSQPDREGSMLPPEIRVRLSNGLIVERKGANGALKVTDPEGKRSGQQLLNQFVEQLALNLPRFMEAGEREKADILLKIIGVGDQLDRLEREEKGLYAERTALGRIADQKQKFAAEMPWYEGVPESPLSAMELIQCQQERLARNGENARKRAVRDELTRRKAHLEAELAQVTKDLRMAEREALELKDESTSELEASIADIEEINRKVRANLDRDKAREDARHYAEQYNALTQRIEAVRAQKAGLLEDAPLPLPGLSVREGRLLYQGRTWDCISGADQLKIATAIVRALNPRCGFVLMDKLEQMDPQTMESLGEWLCQEHLQVIATRVSTGGECSIIIEDGMAQGTEEGVKAPQNWKAGEF